MHSLRTSIGLQIFIHAFHHFPWPGRWGRWSWLFSWPHQVHGHFPCPRNFIYNPQKLLYLSGRSWFQFSIPSWKFMPLLCFVRIGSEVFCGDSMHWSLTDSCFCSHFCSRMTWIPCQLFPCIFHQMLRLDCSFPALAWSVACFTSFLELINHLPNSFTLNMQLFRYARITLTFFMDCYDCISIYSH